MSGEENRYSPCSHVDYSLAQGVMNTFTWEIAGDMFCPGFIGCGHEVWEKEQHEYSPGDGKNRL